MPRGSQPAVSFRGGQQGEHVDGASMLDGGPEGGSQAPKVSVDAKAERKKAHKKAKRQQKRLEEKARDVTKRIDWHSQDYRPSRSASRRLTEPGQIKVSTNAKSLPAAKGAYVGVGKVSGPKVPLQLKQLQDAGIRVIENDGRWVLFS